MKQLWISLLCLFFLQAEIVTPAFSQDKSAVQKESGITIVIEPTFNGQPLKLNDPYYVDDHGDTLYIDLFRFYMTDIKLLQQYLAPFNHDFVETSMDSGRTIKNSFLFDAEDIKNNSFSAASDSNTYSILSFIAGVDSVLNTSGANGGDLDPVKGMYWAWNSGYIMAKLEGHSKVCKTLHHAFEFHIGGYMPPYNAARNVVLRFPDAINMNGHKHAVVTLQADVAAWLKGIDLSKTNSIVIPGKEAAMMADNYAKMFSVKDVRYE